MNMLDRYIVRAILGAVLLVMAVLLVLGALFVFIGQQDDIGIGHYTALDALWYTLLNLPQQAYELLPITALIGALHRAWLAGARQRAHRDPRHRRIGRAPRRHALIAGAAPGRAARCCSGSSSAPPLQQAAREQKAFSRFNNVSFGGGGGAWVRDGNLILNVARPVGPAAVRQHADVRAVAAAPPARARPRSDAPPPARNGTVAARPTTPSRASPTTRSATRAAGPAHARTRT